MEDGKSLDEAKVKKALEAEQMTYISLEKRDIPHPKDGYVLAKAGAG